MNGAIRGSKETVNEKCFYLITDTELKLNTERQEKMPKVQVHELTN